jgi:membrane protein
LQGPTPRRNPTGARASAVERLRALLESDALAAWVDPFRDRSGLRAFGARQVEILVHAARRLGSDEISSRAAALTYYSMVSLVPLLAVGFALFKAFGGLASVHGPLKQLVIDNLAAGRAEEVGPWIDQFLNNIDAGAIAGFGVLMLFYSAVGLLTNIERSFNRVWNVEFGRSLYLRLTIYWCLVTLAPPLVGLSISASAQLQSSSFAAAVLAWLPFGLGRVVITLGSVLAIALVLVLTYYIVPNKKVRFRSAAAGGIVAALLWSMTKALFIRLTAGSIGYSAVYGVLSSLPLLMLWLYVSWNVVLFGVCYANAYQTVARTRIDATPVMSAAFRERLAVRLLVEIARAFRAGTRAPSAEVLAENAGAATAAVVQLLAVLRTTGIVVETRAGARGDEIGYVPARDLQTSTLAEVIDTLYRADEAVHPLREDATQRELDDLLARTHDAARAAIGALTLRDVAELSAPGAAVGRPVQGAVIDETARPI